MAEIALFHYQPHESPLHRYDARHKLPLLILLTAALFHVNSWGLLALATLVASGAWFARLNLALLRRGFLPLALLLLLAFVAEALTLPGERLLAALPVTGEGLAAGGLLVLRLAAVILLGLLFAATTSITSLRSAIVWYLSPFPALRGGRIATMVGLTLSLIPLFFDTAGEISDSQRSRCIEGSGRFVRRTRLLVAPLIVKSFVRADEIVQAMEARCYDDERTPGVLHARRADWLITAGVALAAGACVALLSGPR